MADSGPARIGLGSRLQARAAAAVGSPLFWVVWMLALLSWPIARSIHAERNLPQNRPVVGQIRDFSLIDQNGEVIGSSELRGRVWVASFTFTRCGEICEKMMERAGDVQHRTRQLGDAFRLITFTVDPEHDTPQVIAPYAEEHRPSRHLWHFLSGPPAAVKMAVEDFKVAPKAPQTRFVLVDAAMQIRGYYDMADDGALHLLMRDIGLLVNRGG